MTDPITRSDILRAVNAIGGSELPDLPAVQLAARRAMDALGALAVEVEIADTDEAIDRLTKAVQTQTARAAELRKLRDTPTAAPGWAELP